VADKDTIDTENLAVNQAVAEGGAYELIRKRLIDQGRELETHTQALNQARVDEFGQFEMSVIGRARIRTENNCMARDIVRVGDYLLFGYNVFIGLKKETKVEDVFSLYQLSEQNNGLELNVAQATGTFLDNPQFVKEFHELYAYYKHSKLIQLAVKDQKLLAAFQIGEKVSDVRVFRWSLSPDHSKIEYIDNRGERDIALPNHYDFAWIEVTREYSVHGRHPHFNIMDKVFVETVGGNLTIKVEDNTEDGRGIYSETVEDATQSLDDADIHFAIIGALVLLKIKPYREDEYRYIVFNCNTQQVSRIDEIGFSCVQLPEDHGIIFPGGIYLKTGENKRFEDAASGLRFKCSIKSPNGEDVLYVFYEESEGVAALFPYNLIAKQLKNPVYCHGYTIFDDGRAVIFNAEGDEPTRIHPMQIWQTPYLSDEFASRAPTRQTFLGNIGNAELVRCISDLYSICRAIGNQSPSAYLYEELQLSTRKIYDSYHWIEKDETQLISESLGKVVDTSELILDEFEKVESIRKSSAVALQAAEAEQAVLLGAIHPDRWTSPEEFVSALQNLRTQFGCLLSLKELRYINVRAITELEAEVVDAQDKLSFETVTFLSREAALAPFNVQVDEITLGVNEASSIVEISPLIKQVERLASDLDLLSEMMATLKVDDATVRTAIIESISDVFASLNQCRAKATNRQKTLGQGEAVAQFSARFKLFSQSIANALSVSDSPGKCDEQLSRLLMQLEELEGEFSAYDEFLSDIVAKREEVYESFENRKQQLLDEQNRRAQSITDAADRMIANINRRLKKMGSIEELNTYFSSDALVLKCKELVQSLHVLDNSVKADDIEARLKGAKEQAVRVIRDVADLYEGGGNVIKLGPRHRFNVNNQELDLTIIPRGDELCYHLTGTDFYEVANEKTLKKLSHYWGQALASENDNVYRGEYLAYCLIRDAQQNRNGMDLDRLHSMLPNPAALTTLIREYAAPRYKEGYEKGVHDHDAALLLHQILPVLESCDLLRYVPDARGVAAVYWANQQAREPQKYWPRRAQSALQMSVTFGSQNALNLLREEIQRDLTIFIDEQNMPVPKTSAAQASEYLVYELGRSHIEFVTSKYANELLRKLKQDMDVAGAWRNYQDSLKSLTGQPGARWQLSYAWMEALCEKHGLDDLIHYIPEAIGLINVEGRITRRNTEVDMNLNVGELLGQHSRIDNQTLRFALDEFLSRLYHHDNYVVPEYAQFLDVRQHVIDTQRATLRLEEFKAKPLSSFVRNKLINDAYLPIIGDNLAKQMGTVGDKKRSDLMGLLMMISPPGYGKTTLMEYVASRLGLIFMKINCPSLGHEVDSLDPEQAPNGTAKQELEKLNLALEMGSNVMLYLDDIQHTNPEFLQKFISLCDGTRRIEGIYKGNSKTYDMRGRKFCVVMAGNPYTESGELFKIPDMLANRADIYNLGDVLGGKEEVFALSYLENCLTSNSVLAPLATRNMDDFYNLVDKARGLEVANADLSHAYSGAEVNEIVAILQKLFVVRDVILQVNSQYIKSAAQGEQYRSEPPFKLQGSYRNMNKMAEKISSVMNEVELKQVIDDHYVGEAQLLTTGAEENLLKLKELRGVLETEDSARWESIKSEFNKQRTMGGAGSDSGTKIANQLAAAVTHIAELSQTVKDQKLDNRASETAAKQLSIINKTLQSNTGYSAQLEKVLAALEVLSSTLAKAEYKVEVVNEPVPGMDMVLKTLAETLERSIFPLLQVMEGKLGIDLRTNSKLEEIFQRLRSIELNSGNISLSKKMLDNDT